MNTALAMHTFEKEQGSRFCIVCGQTKDNARHFFQPVAERVTGIYQTQDEFRARRVLQVFTQKSTLHIGFTLKDGWYSILTDTDIPEEAAADFNDLARTVADTDIKAQHLGAFQQWEV